MAPSITMAVLGAMGAVAVMPVISMVSAAEAEGEDLEDLEAVQIPAALCPLRSLRQLVAEEEGAQPASSSAEGALAETVKRRRTARHWRTRSEPRPACLVWLERVVAV